MARGRRLAAVAATWRVLREARRPGSPGLGERTAAVPRMVLATLTGRYRGLDRRRLGMFAVAALYVLSPVDLVPEAALWVLGAADDIGVAAWLAGALLLETDRFLAWEQEQERVVPGEVLGQR